MKTIKDMDLKCEDVCPNECSSIKILKEEVTKIIEELFRKLVKTAGSDVCPFCKQEDPNNCDCFTYFDAQIDILAKFFDLDKEEITTNVMGENF